MNSTMTTFGYPDSLVREYDHWVVLKRPKQVTLGSLVLICKDDVEAFSDINPDAFTELGAVTADIERALGTLTGYQKINYLMLMMVDPNVHFHVLPRYAEPRTFEGAEIADAGWPGPPDLGATTDLTEAQADALLSRLRCEFA